MARTGLRTCLWNVSTWPYHSPIVLFTRKLVDRRFCLCHEASIWGLLAASHRRLVFGKKLQDQILVDTNITLWMLDRARAACQSAVCHRGERPKSCFRILSSSVIDQCDWRCVGLSQWVESGRRSLLEYRCIPRPHRKRSWKPGLKRKNFHSSCHAWSQICCHESLVEYRKIMDRQSYQSEIFHFGKVKTQPRNLPLPRRQPDFTKPFQALAHRPSSCFKP